MLLPARPPILIICVRVRMPCASSATSPWSTRSSSCTATWCQPRAGRPDRVLRGDRRRVRAGHLKFAWRVRSAGWRVDPSVFGCRAGSGRFGEQFSDRGQNRVARQVVLDCVKQEPFLDRHRHCALQGSGCAGRTRQPMGTPSSWPPDPGWASGRSARCRYRRATPRAAPQQDRGSARCDHPRGRSFCPHVSHAPHRPLRPGARQVTVLR